MRRLKKQPVEECVASLSWLENDGLMPVSVTVLNTNQWTGKYHRKDLETALQLNGEQEADLVSMMLYVKDKYNISGSAYHEFASLSWNAKALSAKRTYHWTKFKMKHHPNSRRNGSSAMIEGTPNCMSRATGVLKPYCMCVCNVCVCACMKFVCETCVNSSQLPSHWMCVRNSCLCAYETRVCMRDTRMCVCVVCVWNSCQNVCVCVHFIYFSNVDWCIPGWCSLFA